MKNKPKERSFSNSTKQKPIKVRTRMSPLARFCRKIVKFFLGKHTVINLNDHDLPDQCILLCTHKGMKGPFVYQSFLPRFCVPWGAHEMLGNYRQRWNYMYHVFYRKKLKMKKLAAFLKATIIALFNKLLYNGCRVIGTYNDARQIKAIRTSIAHLEAGVPVMMFPENSNEGYFDILTECHGGFAVLAKTYNKKHHTDIPVYPSYYCPQQKAIVIGQPLYVGNLSQQGMTRDQIAEHVRHTINSLSNQLIQETRGNK